jgi:hypothetical protein
LHEVPPDLETPPLEKLRPRLLAVHRVLYLLFNEGYLSAHAEHAIRRELCDDAVMSDLHRRADHRELDSAGFSVHAAAATERCSCMPHSKHAERDLPQSAESNDCRRSRRFRLDGHLGWPPRGKRRVLART